MNKTNTYAPPASEKKSSTPLGPIPRILERWSDEEDALQQSLSSNPLWKRSFDLVASTVALFALSPFLAIVALAVALDSDGPILFTQLRKGKNQRTFRIYKFRTMVNHAHLQRRNLGDDNEVDGILFKIKQDARITRIGALLRKYSVDELPQLLNIVRGDMSFVGPRPLPLEDFEKGPVHHPLFERWLHVRHLVLPGLTGLWQVSGRNDLPFAKMMELDTQYAERVHWVTDLKILWRTVGVVFSKHGAY